MRMTFYEVEKELVISKVKFGTGWII